MSQRLPSWMFSNAAQNVLKEGLRWNSPIAGITYIGTYSFLVFNFVGTVQLRGQMGMAWLFASFSHL